MKESVLPPKNNKRKRKPKIIIGLTIVFLLGFFLDRIGILPITIPALSRAEFAFKDYLAKNKPFAVNDNVSRAMKVNDIDPKKIADSEPIVLQRVHRIELTNNGFEAEIEYDKIREELSHFWIFPSGNTTFHWRLREEYGLTHDDLRRLVRGAWRRNAEKELLDLQSPCSTEPITPKQHADKFYRCVEMAGLTPRDFLPRGVQDVSAMVKRNDLIMQYGWN